MRFKDQLVRCGACGKQFVFTVREQRRRAEQGKPVDAPAFCEECRGADVRLAEADGSSGGKKATAAAPAKKPEKKSSAKPASSRAATRSKSRKRRTKKPDRSKAPRSSGSKKKAKGRGRGGSRRSEQSRQTELRFRHLGTVKWFDGDRGYGFIAQDDGEEVFVHCSAVLSSGSQVLEQGTPVEFEVEQTERGLQAVDVVLLA